MTGPHLVILGGGFAGLTLAKALRRTPYRITLVDRRNHHLFQPLLYQVATAGLAPGDIAEPIRGILARNANVEVRLGKAESIDVDARVVHLEGGDEIAYDELVVATGASHAYFGNDAWADHAPGLKTIGDALEIRRRILNAFERAEWADVEARAALLTFVVVGAGPTGVEMAGAIREIATKAMRGEFRHFDPVRDTRVILVEAGPSVLGVYPDPLPAKARRQLEDLGVEVRTGKPVESLDADGVVVDGEAIAAKTIVWAAGVKASSLGGDLGVALDRAGRVPVQPDLSVEGHPEVFVLGDLARFEQDGAPLPGIAPVAIQQAKHLAGNLKRALRDKARRPFRYTDLGTMATIGRSRAIADVMGIKASGFIAWLMWVFVHLMTLVGHRNRLVVFLKWAWAWVTWERSSRLVWQGETDAPWTDVPDRSVEDTAPAEVA